MAVAGQTTMDLLILFLVVLGADWLEILVPHLIMLCVLVPMEAPKLKADNRLLEVEVNAVLAVSDMVPFLRLLRDAAMLLVVVKTMPLAAVADTMAVVRGDFVVAAAARAFLSAKYLRIFRESILATAES